MNGAAKEALSEAVDAAAQAADKAVRSPWTKRLAKLGFLVKGCLYLVIGALALAAVIGVRGVYLADPRGAMAVVADRQYGRVFLLIFVVGAIGQGVWNILRGITDVDVLGRHWFAILVRCVQCLTGIFYLGLAISAAEIILSSRVNLGSSIAEETFVASLLAIPITGLLLTIVIGLGLIGAGFAESYNGITGRFQANYRKWQFGGFHGVVITVLGVLSFSVRAVLLVIMGWFFIRAGFDGKAGGIGIDAALLSLLQTSYGPVLVAFAGAGLIAHGVLAFYEAKYRRLA